MMARLWIAFMVAIFVMAGCGSPLSTPVTAPERPTVGSPLTEEDERGGAWLTTPTPEQQLRSTPALIFGPPNAEVTPTAARSQTEGEAPSLQEVIFSGYNIVAPP